MSNVQLDELCLEILQEVITSRDYETCPTIKSNNETNTMTVVKSDGNPLSIETGTNHDCDNHYKSPENRSVGGAHQ